MAISRTTAVCKPLLNLHEVGFIMVAYEGISEFGERVFNFL